MFSSTYSGTNQSSAGERKPDDFGVRLAHISSGCGAVHVHRSSDIRVPHQPLLDPDGSTDGVSEDRWVCRNVWELV